MKRILVMLLVFYFAAVSISYAEVFQINNMDEGKSTRSLAASDKSTGKPLWQSEVMTQKIEHKGKTFLYLKEEGRGIHGKDKKFQSWISECYSHFDGKRAIPYQSILVFRDKSGKVIQRISKFYDLDAKKVFCQINGEEKSFEFKEDIVDSEFLGTALRGYPFEEKRDVIFHLLTNEPTLYKITMKYKGVETIQIGERAVKCYKLQMIPDLGLLNIFGAFVPQTYFWYETSPPHAFVRYEGLESGLGTPYIVLE